MMKSGSINALKSNSLKKQQNPQLGKFSESQINELAVLIEMAEINTTAICICNEQLLRKKILISLKNLLLESNVGLFEILLDKSNGRVVNTLIEVEKSGPFQTFKRSFGKLAVSIDGIEKIFEETSLTSVFFENINLYRDYFVRSKYPTIFWMTEEIASEIARKAPDFWRARTKLYVFKELKRELKDQFLSLKGLSRSFNSFEDIKRREEILRSLLKNLSVSNDAQAYIVLTLNLAALLYLECKFDDAEILAIKCLKISKKIKNTALTIECLTVLGDIQISLAKYDQASELLTEGLKIAKRTGIKSSEFTLNNLYDTLSKIEFFKGNYDKAKSLVVELLNNLKEAGENDSTLNFDASQSLGMIEADTGNPLQAKKLFEDLLKNQEIDNFSKSKGLNNLGVVEMRLNNLDKAEYYFNQSLKIDQKLDFKPGLGVVYHNLGAIYRRKGQNNQALTYLQRSLEIQKEIRDTEGIASNLSLIGQVYLGEGNYEKSLKYFLESGYIYSLLKSPEEGNVIRDIVNSIEKIDPEKLNKLLQEVPLNFRSYYTSLLKQPLFSDHLTPKK